MSLKEIAVDGLTISHADGSPISGGTFTITSSPSTRFKCDGSGVYAGTLTFTFTGGSAEGFVDKTVATTVPQAIAATATRVKTGGLAVLRLGDSGTMACMGTPTVTPPASAPVAGSVEITDAGQTRVKAS